MGFKVISITDIKIYFLQKPIVSTKYCPYFWSLFLLDKFILYRDNVCFNLILVISSQSKRTSLKRTPAYRREIIWPPQESALDRFYFINNWNNSMVTFILMGLNLRSVVLIDFYVCYWVKNRRSFKRKDVYSAYLSDVS